MVRGRIPFVAIAASLVALSFVHADQGDDSVRLVTFAKDIAPLLQQRCQECHRPGQGAPMSLLTYDEVRPWAKAIQQAVTRRDMPPFHAAGPLGRYVDDLRLSDEQIGLVNRWVDAGAPLGDPEDIPAPRVWNDSEWLGGEPDLVIPFPRFEIRSDGVDDNVDLYSEYEFPEDMWLKLVEVRPSNRQALHHANVFLTIEGESVPESLMIREMKSNLLAHPLLVQWLPGRTFEEMPEGEAIRAYAGRRIMLNAHYAPSIQPRQEETQIGIQFADGEITTVHHTMALMSYGKIRPIEPNDANFRHTFRQVFDSDALITGFHFHMHYRGASASISFVQPDGTIVHGIDVPNYNFNWQRRYVLSEPFTVPGGTEAVVELHWDNSASNPLNPDPTQRVIFGRLTTNEMGAAGIGYYDDSSRLEAPIRVKDGRRVED